ncbi:MAG TPA: PVC-type heme-binding CxxCH protein, partial [Pirellulales bacterium]|nr:PVC-type heme-binding CxxCH protein [Pirellulales bacterium]
MNGRARNRWALLIGLCLAPQVAHAGDNLGLKVPDGFEVTLYADDALAHNTYAMTCDSHGRIVVSGPGYVSTLIDDDHDGRADRSILFSSKPASGAQGLYFEGNDLICTGDNSVLRLRDADGDGVADDEGQEWFHAKSSEHGPHAIVSGPDGWLYMAAGNGAEITAEHITLSGSPVTKPSCGTILRMSRDGTQRQVIAHGFRNPYDLDFNARGQLFTVDSDSERETGLPWYASTRLFDVATGMSHGWLYTGSQMTWNRPPWFADSVERLVEFGRGSPTGLIVYRHTAFPPQYRNAVFTCCWTLGKVYAVPLTRRASTWTGELDTFLRTVGDVGFAPVDLAVDPAGDLFVAVGGRGTRGSVFRIRWTGEKNTAPTDPTPEIDRVLQAPQPLSSWSRASWVPIAKTLGAAAFESVVVNKRESLDLQVRAIEVLVDVFDGLSTEAASKAIDQRKPELSARVAWALGCRPARPGTRPLLVALSHENHPLVQRAVWEAVMMLPTFDPHELPADPRWLRGLGHEDRRVRAAAIVAGSGVARDSCHRAAGEFQPEEDIPVFLSQLWLDQARPGESSVTHEAYVNACLSVIETSEEMPQRVEALRLLEVLLGDVELDPPPERPLVGYSAHDAAAVAPALRQQIVERVCARFPSPDTAFDYEASRVLAMLEAQKPDLLAHLTNLWSDRSSPIDDEHYLFVASRLKGPRSAEFTSRTAETLLALHGKLADRQIYPDRNWPTRIGECFRELCRLDPALGDAVANARSFGRPEHALFASLLEGDAQQRAARRLLVVLERQSDDDVVPVELIRVLGMLPADEILPKLRHRWDDYAVRDAIALVLAKHAQEVDRSKLVESLASAESDVV